MSFLFNVSIPSHSSFLEPLRDLSVRVAEYAGYPQDDARALGATIADGAAQAIKSGAKEKAIDLAFETDDGRFKVTLTYQNRSPKSAVPSEFVCRRRGRLSICRLARDLPTIELGG